MSSIFPPLVATAFELGLVSRDDIVSLADDTISAVQAPPPWLIELSCAPSDSSPYDFGRLLPRDPAVTDDEYLAFCAYGWSHGVLELRKIGGLLYQRFCIISWKEMTPLRQSIYVYDDELDWDVARALRTLTGILGPYVALGDELITRIKKPNKALVPTPASVTPAAGAPVAPDAGAAHL